MALLCMLTTEEGRGKEACRVQGAQTVFIPLYAASSSSSSSSDSQIGSARNVYSDMTLSESIVSQDLHSHCHIRPLQRSQ